MRFAAGTVVLAGAASLSMSAQAADMPPPAPAYEPTPPPVVAPLFDWTGFYLGGHVGYGWGKNRVSTWAMDTDGNILIHPQTQQPITSRNSFDIDGWLGGGQVGFNWQWDQVVFGVEGDFSWTNIDGSFQFDPSRPEARAGADIDWIATLRGRIGYSFDNVLIYATAGAAWAKMNGFVNHFWSATDPADRATSSKTRSGWTAGGGVEVALTESLSLKGEYLYIDLGSDTVDMRSSAFAPGTFLRVRSKTDIHTVRLGANFRLPMN